MKLSVILLSAVCAAIPQIAAAHGPLPVPLIGVPIPPVPGLTDGSDPIVVNKDMAIALGKALFWDMNVGSDGMACASCHFHAGADNRVKNQMNPGTLNPHPDNQFDVLPSGNGGPNHTLTMADFPLTRFADPFNKASGLAFTTDDAVASSGTFSGDFTGVSPFRGSNDKCVRSADPVYNVGGVGTRRVEPRNAPTIINAVFNNRTFWDGRGNNIFNGSNNWGDRDPDAGVWVQVNRRTVRKQALHLENSALASQAVATAMSQLEMTCANRSIADIGRKLLLRKPLQYQKVHKEDSVFGPMKLTYSTAAKLKPGLKTTYKNMIRAAFAPKYWAYPRRGQFGKPASGGLAYTQMEANFPMFFGLAIQMYESTLVSDQAPIDTVQRDPDTYKPIGLSESELRGMEAFTAVHCNLCHAGPVTTTNAIVSNSMLVTPTAGATFGPDHSPRAFGPAAMGKAGFDNASDAGIAPNPNVVIRDVTRNPAGSKLIDFGFFNTGVGDPDADPGLGGLDAFNKPLSYSAQYVQYLMGNSAEVKDPAVKQIHSCQFIAPLAIDLGYEVDFAATFTQSADREADGSREGGDEIALRSQNCYDSMAAYIPTIDAAVAAFNNPNDLKLAVASKAAFKIPTLRNIELTGPYMHNGSMATLEQVIEFYARGGNFDNSNQGQFIAPSPLAGASPISRQAREDLVAFLKTLTDDRVRYERAPFDHPELTVPNGHPGDDQLVQSGNPLSADLAKDSLLLIPAVGASGVSAPIGPFLAP